MPKDGIERVEVEQGEPLPVPKRDIIHTRTLNTNAGGQQKNWKFGCGKLTESSSRVTRLLL